MLYDKSKTMTRLKNLRKSHKWTQAEMGNELNKSIGYDSQANIMNLAGENGKQTVSQLENGRNITIDIAFAYADIFDVSLDYIYGRSKSQKQQYESIEKEIGLTGEAVRMITKIKSAGYVAQFYRMLSMKKRGACPAHDNYPTYLDILNAIIEDETPSNMNALSNNQHSGLLHVLKNLWIGAYAQINGKRNINPLSDDEGQNLAERGLVVLSPDEARKNYIDMAAQDFAKIASTALDKVVAPFLPLDNDDKEDGDNGNSKKEDA